ncbi:MAG: TlpA disulfide reductase family protein [Nocardioidaceae bacterium]
MTPRSGRHSRTLGSAGVVAAIVLAGGCSSSPTASAPVFGGAGGGVSVDGPALQKVKAAAGIVDCPSTHSASPVAGGLPSVTLPCLGGGRPVDLAALRGTPMLVNVWASYCGPCREEMPLLQRLHHQAAGRILVLGIDMKDGSPGGALSLAAHTGATYPLLADPTARSAPALHVQALPVSLLVTASGRIVETRYGAFTSYSDLVDTVRTRLGVTP